MVKNDKIKVAILGSTGMIGQVFAWLLANHDEFEIAAICASDPKAGKSYVEVVQWNFPRELKKEIKEMLIDKIDYRVFEKRNIKIVFSALPSDIARQVEGGLRERGFFVFSNASAFRYDEDVPILIPEANPGEISKLKMQIDRYSGAIVTNANCSTTGLACALAPLNNFGIQNVFVSTYQSVSGAGYPGVPSMDIMGNIVPFISGEENKMKIELQKILRRKINVFPFCARVPVLYGHLETVWLKFEKSVTKNEIIDKWNSFKGSPQIPSMPDKPIKYIEKDDLLQTKLSFQGDPPGMQVFTGRLKQEGEYFGFVLLVNNIVKGGAGGSVQNGELFLRNYGEYL